MKKINRVIERFCEWSLGRLPFWLLVFAMACILAAVFIQIGISHGRELERADIEEDTEALRASINTLEAEIGRLTKDALIAGIIECESSGRHTGIWGDGGRNYGIAQFQRRTFFELAKKSGIEGLDWKDRDDQIRLLRWSVDNGYGEYWTCYRKLMKG